MVCTVAAHKLDRDYRRLCRVPENSIFIGLLKKHGVVALDHGPVQCPSFALAHKMRGRCGRFFWNAGLFLFELDGMRYGLKSRGGHVEQHFTQMGATLNTANVRIYGSAPSCAQGATN